MTHHPVNHLIVSTGLCPCGSKKLYADCCDVYHRGTPAPSARLLMPSRYSAYVLGLRDYLLKTWHKSTRPTTLTIEPEIQWCGLEIKHAEIIDADSATVEFIAHYQIDQRKHRLHEISHFVSEEGQWYYVNGLFRDASREIRNT